MINSSFAGTWGQADRLTARQGKRARREEMERAKKKRCGFTMFVIESAAAGCGIPNDSLRKKSPSRTATCTMLSRIYLYFS